MSGGRWAFEAVFYLYVFPEVVAKVHDILICMNMTMNIDKHETLKTTHIKYMCKQNNLPVM